MWRNSEPRRKQCMEIPIGMGISTLPARSGADPEVNVAYRPLRHRRMECVPKRAQRTSPTGRHELARPDGVMSEGADTEGSTMAEAVPRRG
jgi:hypothetical protein